MPISNSPVAVSVVGDFVAIVALIVAGSEEVFAVGPPLAPEIVAVAVGSFVELDFAIV